MGEAVVLSAAPVRFDPAGRLAARAVAVAATLASPALRLALRRRLARGKEIEGRLGERRGIEPSVRPPGRLVWLHAASVGESLAVLPVLDGLVAAADAPFVLLTTGTATSARLLDGLLRRTPARARAAHRMAPLDVPRWGARFLDHWRPDCAVFVESELWPNLIGACVGRAIPLALINGRMSPASAAAWRRVRPLARRLLGAFSLVVARTEADAARLAALGARIDDVGDLKRAAADLGCDETERGRLASLLAGREVLIAASTHPGEEAIVAEAHARLRARHPTLLTIVVPRHPERGRAVAALLGGAPRRGDGRDPDPAHGFWVVDTLGELGLVYRLGRIAFLGRSLSGTAPGGQNPFEPARLALALATGPWHANFTEAVTALGAASALAVVRDASDLADWAGAMLADTAAARAAGCRAREVASVRPGLPDELARAILDLSAASGRAR